MKITIKEKIKAITKWQNCNCVHPLTCRNNGCNHVPLKPIEKEGKVMLVCRDCDYEQEYLPEYVLKADINKIERNTNKILEELKKGKNE